MVGMARFGWIVDDEPTDIYFFGCKNGEWVDWHDEDDEDDCSRYEHYFSSGIEFEYLGHKIILTAEEINNDWEPEDAAELVQALNLPCELPDALTKEVIYERLEGCYWSVDGEEQKIDIVWSQVTNVKWANLEAEEKCKFINTSDRNSENIQPCEFCYRPREYDYYTYEWNFSSGIEFEYLGHKIILTAEEINNDWEPEDAAELVQALNLPCELPDALKKELIDDRLKGCYWSVDGEDQKIDIVGSQVTKAKWVNLQKPQCKFKASGQFFEEENEDDEQRYYYIFNRGIAFTYLDRRIIMSPNDLKSLHISAVSMLLEVLNLDED
ncbi:hypothetical protein [Microcoleus sp. S13_C5]|uniref:hypothetical protein n=1 Tax=Microcoleus sp. S13_C5 TaxID=3055411 RepID=UPI002FD17050